jgi:hypothetical protein
MHCVSDDEIGYKRGWVEESVQGHMTGRKSGT